MEVLPYHASQPDWRQHSIKRAGDLVGVELEVFHPDGNQSVADVLDRFNANSYPYPIAEIDGSLSRTNGVEIVCPPLPTAELLTDDGYMENMMRSLREIGTEAPVSGYGMHLNFNVADWEPGEKAIVQYMLNRMDTVVSRVSRRRGGFGDFRPTFKFYRHGREKDATRIVLTTYPSTKYAAAHLRPPNARVSDRGPLEGRSQVLEFRAPAATLDKEHLRVAVEMVFALRNWAKAFGGDALAACYLTSLSLGATGAALLEQSFAHYWMQTASERISNMVGRMISVDRAAERTPYEMALENITALTKGLTPQEMTVIDDLGRAVRKVAVLRGDIIYDGSTTEEQALGIAKVLSEVRPLLAAEPDQSAAGYAPPTAASICAGSKLGPVKAAAPVARKVAKSRAVSS